MKYIRWKADKWSSYKSALVGKERVEPLRVVIYPYSFYVRKDRLSLSASVSKCVTGPGDLDSDNASICQALEIQDSSQKLSRVFTSTETASAKSPFQRIEGTACKIHKVDASTVHRIWVADRGAYFVKITYRTLYDCM